jgi:hypothetical protein
MQELYGQTMSSGIGAHACHGRSYSQLPADRDSSQPSAQTSTWDPRRKSFTSSSPAPRPVRNSQGVVAEGLVAEAVGAIRAGMRQRGAHGGLAFERAIAACRERCVGVGAFQLIALVSST